MVQSSRLCSWRLQQAFLLEAGSSAVEEKKGLDVSVWKKLDQAELSFGTSPFPSGDRKGWLPEWGAARCHLWLWQQGVESASRSCCLVFMCSGKNLQESKMSSGPSSGHYSHQAYPTWLICLRLSVRWQYDIAMEMNDNEILGPVCWGVTSREKRYPCHEGGPVDTAAGVFCVPFYKGAQERCVCIRIRQKKKKGCQNEQVMYSACVPRGNFLGLVNEGRAHACCKYIRVVDTSTRQLLKLMQELSTRVEIHSFWK